MEHLTCWTVRYGHAVRNKSYMHPDYFVRTVTDSIQVERYNLITIVCNYFYQNCKESVVHQVLQFV